MYHSRTLMIEADTGWDRQRLLQEARERHCVRDPAEMEVRHARGTRQENYAIRPDWKYEMHEIAHKHQGIAKTTRHAKPHKANRHDDWNSMWNHRT
jgi:hypothetical protein